MKTTTAFNELFQKCFTKVEILTHRKQAAISSRIEMWRAEHGMTQKQFAEFVGVTQTMVSKWESGEYNFTIKTLATLSEKLDIDINQLFTGLSAPRTTVSYVLVHNERSQSASYTMNSAEFGFSANTKTSTQFPGGIVA